MNRIPFSNPRINTKNTLSIIKKALKKSFPNEGEQTTEFEKKLRKLLRVKYVVTTNSGTVALFLALKANDIKKNDEVLVPNITFPATANAVLMAGGKPVLVDVDPTNLLIDEKSLLKNINRKTKFVIPVHISGRGSNIKKILKICKKKNLKVIEDAAEALFSKFDNKYLGSFSNTGCFSFAPNKIITTGQGGAVVTDKKKIYLKLLKLKDQGRTASKVFGQEDVYNEEGYNFKFTNLQSSLGISQLTDIDWRKKKLIKIHKFYIKNINQNSNFRFINFKLTEGELPLWTDVFCSKRKKLIIFLKKKGIICRVFWKPLNKCGLYKKSFANFPNSKKLQQKLMWLPSSLTLSLNKQRRICNLINSFFEKNYN